MNSVDNCIFGLDDAPTNHPTAHQPTYSNPTVSPSSGFICETITVSGAPESTGLVNGVYKPFDCIYNSRFAIFFDFANNF